CPEGQSSGNKRDPPPAATDAGSVNLSVRLAARLEVCDEGSEAVLPEGEKRVASATRQASRSASSGLSNPSLKRGALRARIKVIGARAHRAHPMVARIRRQSQSGNASAAPTSPTRAKNITDINMVRLPMRSISQPTGRQNRAPMGVAHRLSCRR